MPYQPEASRPKNWFIELPVIDSTNNYALERVHAGLAHSGECIFTQEQTKGKGQRGRSWAASRGQNILMSTILSPQIPLSQQFHLSVAVSLGVFDFFLRHTDDQTKIKWPNDLYWQDRKAGGILIENIVSTGVGNTAAWKWAIIGTGININQDQFEQPGAVSMRQITGKLHDPIELAHELYEHILIRVDQLYQTGFPDLLTEYNQILYKKGEMVKLRKDNRVFETMIKGVNGEGQLVTGLDVEEVFEFGEVGFER